MCNSCDDVREYAKNNVIPAKDWKITSVEEFPGDYYRFRVSGENLNYPPEHRERRFSWRVPNIDDARYDWSAVR